MRRFLIGECLLCALWCANTIGQDQNASFKIEGMAAPCDVEFTAQADGSKQRYVEFLPLGYTSNQSCSLMLFLHGHGADRWQITKGVQWREIQAVCDVAARLRMILISPDYRAPTSWMGPAAEADVVQIIQEQKIKRPISKIFLSGGSMGGTSVLIFTALHPELVDGVVSMNGTANMIEFAGFEEPIGASYGGTKSERPDEYQKRSPELMAAKFGTIPMAFTAGGKDAVVPPQSVLRLSKELEAQNPGQVLMLYREEVGHTTSYEDAIAALDFVIERGAASSNATAIGKEVNPTTLEDKVLRGHQGAELIRTLKPLSIRGVNYYPRETPWGGLWTKTSREVLEKDMALAASLRINTVRTFIMFSSAMEQAGLLRKDGAPTPAYLEKIETFLAAAWKHRIRAILCFEFSRNWLAAPDARACCQRALSAVITAHREDGRVLLWDLMNEPEDDAKWTDGTRAYLRAALPLIKQLDPHHLTTVGLTWRIDRLVTVGLPDVLQYHEYSPKARLFQDGTTRVRQDIASQRKVGGQRPLLIGEFGMNTARDPKHGVEESLRAKLQEHPGTEAEQARIYEIVLAAAVNERVAGVLSWCLHDYPVKNPNESHFGLVRGDGTLKPAALVLRDTFARWSSSRPLVGAIRWDAWWGGRVTEEVERTLGAAKYHDRLPWFANVTGDHQVRIDGSQPGIMEQEIDFAANAGLDYWAFLLYPESDSMSHALKQYLKSPKRRRLKFCVILHNAFGVPEAAWPREVARVVSLLKEPGYQTVLGNRPLVFEFQARLGGQFPRQRFAEFRRAAQEAGLNPYCVFMGWNPAADFARESVNGFDAVSAYALGSNVRTFAELARQVEQTCWQKAAEAKVPLIPLVTTGWDKQPRKDHPVSWEKNQPYHQQGIFPSRAEPQEIASHLERALAFVGKHSDCCAANTVIVYAWNEHDEGGWLAPTWTPSGQANTTRLSAVRAVLSSRGVSLITPHEATE